MYPISITNYDYYNHLTNNTAMVLLFNIKYYVRLRYFVGRKFNGVIRLHDFRCESRRMTVGGPDGVAWQTTLQSVAGLIKLLGLLWYCHCQIHAGYIKISLIRRIIILLYIREILITGTNNVIKLVRFADFSLCRFSVRVDGRYSVSYCCRRSFHFVIFKRPHNVPYSHYCSPCRNTTYYLTRSIHRHSHPRHCDWFNWVFIKVSSK